MERIRKIQRYENKKEREKIIKDIEKRLGRKLTVNERYKLESMSIDEVRAVQGKVKKQQREKKKTNLLEREIV
jgi:hypothetical protein